MVLAWAALVACTGENPGEPAVTLEGPPEVRVDELGPVPSPRVLRGDGTEAGQVAWTVHDPAIATVRDGSVIATGAGSTQVTGVVGEDRVVYTLHVEPAVVLRFADPPAEARVGETTDLPLEGAVEGVEWVSSDPAIATVAGGRLTGVAPGLVYVTARKGASEALLQLEVRGPEGASP
jgi:hypothetical protein